MMIRTNVVPGRMGRAGISASALVLLCGAATATPPCLENRSPDGDPYVYQSVEEMPCDTGSDWQNGRIAVDFYTAGDAVEADSHSSAKFLPDGSAVVVANRDSRTLAVFDPLTRNLVSSIPLSGRPESVAITPDGLRAVTANLRDNTASVVDLVAGAEIAVIPVGTAPTTALINTGGTLAVISNGGSQDASVIDLSTLAVVRTVATGGVFTQVSVNPETAAYAFKAYGPALAGNTLVFPDALTEQTKLIDITTGSTTSLATGTDPVGVAVTPDGTKAVVTHYFASRKLAVIDIASGTISATYTSPVDMWGPVTVNPSGTKAVVAVQNACRVVNLATGAFSADISTASVNELYTSADGQYAVCVGFRGSLISYATSSWVKDLNNFVSTSVGAVSPAGPLSVQFSDTFGEDMVVINTAGAGGSLLSAGPSGPAPEADRARTVAVTPDSLKTVVVSSHSQTASVMDSYTGEVTAWVGVDRRPGEVEITSDGTKAVVSSRDGTKLSIITLADGSKTDVTISTRADQVEISPDGQFAYVAVVVSDGVWRVNLNTGAVQGPMLVTGNMGSTGYSFQQFSGMTLSPDGSTLVTCDSFTNAISIIDTASWSVVKTLAVGTFPTVASFSADSSKIYVTNRDSDNISVVTSAGAASAVTATIAVGDGPYLTRATPDGSKLYVCNWNANNIGVVNLGTNVQFKTIAMAAGESMDGLEVDPTGSSVYVSHGQASISFGGGGYSTSQTGSVRVISTATDTITQTIPTGRCGAMLELSANGYLAAIAQPWGDGVSFVDFVDCPADFDHSGFADTDDYDAFVQAYELGIIAADFDDSGFVDTDDFDAFVHAYEAGC
jgi:YVTN family beta-propeller protein